MSALSPADDPESPDWRRPRPPVERSDWWLGGGLFVVALVSWTITRSIPGAPDTPAWLTIGLLALMTLPLVLRRRYPVPVGLVGVVAYVVLGELGLPEVTVSQVTLFLAVYVIGAWTGSRRLAMWSRIAIITAMAIWLYIGLVRFAQLPMEAQTGAFTPLVAQTALTVLVNAMYFAGAYWFGNHSWRSAQQRAVLEARTAQLADERERVGRQAVALERLRVARELHDAVAHHVALMGVQAAAARAVLRTDPDLSARTMEQLEQSARSAVDELYSLLGTLRDDDEDPTPNPVGVDQLGDLVDGTRSSGRQVDLQVIGDPRPIPPAVSVALYRVAQEALTNVVKHTTPLTRTQVRLRWGEHYVEVEVSDDGTGRSAAPHAGRGLGQRNMKERVAALNGQLEMGPRIGSGYLVRARFEVQA